MLPPSPNVRRRDFLRLSAGAAAGLCVGAGARTGDEPQGTERLRSVPPPNPNKPAKKIAVVTTAYHYLSHAYHVCGRFLYGYLRNGRMHYPDFAIAGMHVEQQKDNDLSKGLAKKHGFGLYPDVAGALTLGGTKLAVDGVLLIGEHGDYPYNEKGQKLYPRYELFQKIVEVFKQSGHSVPVFNDKHLYYDRRKAREMVDTARTVGFPLMAGSSLPVTWRRPEVEPPLGTPFEEVVVASRGEIEIYGFHALESLQCMAERRKGGETGVKTVTCLEGDAVWKAGDDGVWSWDLLEEALSRTPSLNVGDIRENCRHHSPPPGRPTFPRGPVAFAVEYRDGFRGTALLLNGHIDDTTFAGRVAGEKKPISTLFYLPPPPGAAFLQALTEKVEGFLATGKPPYPIERNLLTTGILDAVLDARVKKRRLDTPDLAIAYEAPKDSGFLRGEYNRAATP
jgi:hypothetical protein